MLSHIKNGPKRATREITHLFSQFLSKNQQRFERDILPEGNKMNLVISGFDFSFWSDQNRRIEDLRVARIAARIHAHVADDQISARVGRQGCHPMPELWVRRIEGSRRLWPD